MSAVEADNGAEVVQNLTSLTSDLLESLVSGSSKSDTKITAATSESSIEDNTVKSRIRNHVRSCYQFSENNVAGIKNPVSLTFDLSCEWINTAAPDLSKEASSKIIIVEFFTHCCINCIHSINELRQTLDELKKNREKQEKESNQNIGTLCDFKLISIHSPKFSREQDSESVRAFVQKVRMDHSAVVNDPKRTLWESLGICCWPTILVFGPNPLQNSTQLNLIFVLLGEGHGPLLKTMLQVSSEYFNEMFRFGEQASIENTNFGQVNHASIKSDTDNDTINSLSYPGKVCVHNNGRLLAISDSGNNRILIVSADGQLLAVFGHGKGYTDGVVPYAQFSNPQGICFETETIINVADTGNHAIRRINLLTKFVSTIISWNSQVSVDNQFLTLKSPWDLAFYGKDVLLIAAAGNHQIFGYFLQQTEFFGVLHDANVLKLVAGTGKEENRNNSYILKSSFAQPSGIAVGNGNVFIADSESSSIRMIERTGKVVGLVGGAKDPTDLFAFGDEDGISFEAKLQHPVGVCCSADGSKLYIADTFNHKVKMIETATKRCRTLIGQSSGDRDGLFSCVEQKRRNSPGRSKSPDVLIALLNEPGGVTYDEPRELLYIADTNNHKIKVANTKDRTVETLKIVWDPPVGPTAKNPSGQSKSFPPRPQVNETFEVPFHADSNGISIELHLLNLSKNCEGGEWKVTSALAQPKSGKISISSEDKLGVLLVENVLPVNATTLEISVNLFFCSKTTCYMRPLLFKCQFKHSQNETEIFNPVKLIYSLPENFEK